MSAMSVFVCAHAAWAQTYGIVDETGEFVPKVTVSVENKEILIKKVEPREKFRSISIKINKNNPKLIHNVGLLNIQWISYQNRAGRPLPFAGPKYNPQTRVFKDSMTKSRALRIIDKSAADLFAGKEFSDLFSLSIEGKPAISSDSYFERKKKVTFDEGRDLSVDIDKQKIAFTKENLKTGEMINVENRTQFDQVLGVKLPESGLLYYQIIRKPEPKKIPAEEWNRFTVKPDSGFFIVLIPDPDPLELARLDDKSITIDVWEGGKVRESKTIPIRVSSELSAAAAQETTAPPLGPEETTDEPADAFGPLRNEPLVETPVTPTEDTAPAPEKKPEPAPEAKPAPAQEGGSSNIPYWILQIATLIAVLLLGVYTVVFLLPRIQVLEDRLAKNEMFIHGSREAIREELEEIKEDILSQCQRDSDSE